MAWSSCFLVWLLIPLSLSWLCQLRCGHPVAQTNFKQVLNLFKQVFLCLKCVANLDQSALELAESRLWYMGEAQRHTLPPDLCVSCAGLVKTPFPKVTVPAALHRSSSPTGSSLLHSKHELWDVWWSSKAWVTCKYECFIRRGIWYCLSLWLKTVV